MNNGFQQMWAEKCGIMHYRVSMVVQYCVIVFKYAFLHIIVATKFHNLVKGEAIFLLLKCQLKVHLAKRKIHNTIPLLNNKVDRQMIAKYINDSITISAVIFLLK